ncbi:hypothetical protein LIN78_11865 [Leeia sp. TBRC 13508]|uniref:50S ribosomal protein L29 n=1 Tax=Leeia speluncae TaxID=2884804 RepID=A0ABS8D7S2_9NEIS|nr:hypothetical protein [Leeia speluncae]MCB6184240.1 hypothetical protein [Leeia speluncae]
MSAQTTPLTREERNFLKSRVHAVEKELKFWNTQPLSAFTQRRVDDLQSLLSQLRASFPHGAGASRAA